VQGGQNKLRCWLSESVAVSVKGMGKEGQEGVNVGDLKKWHYNWKVDFRMCRVLKTNGA
jgi:hypothetical protein